MIKHVCVGNEAVSLYTVYLDTKDAAADHHTDLRVLLERELSVLRHLIADGVVVLLDVANLLADLVLVGAAFEPRALFLSVKDGEVVECLGQDICVLVKVGHILALVLHNIGGQERVLG